VGVLLVDSLDTWDSNVKSGKKDLRRRHIKQLADAYKGSAQQRIDELQGDQKTAAQAALKQLVDAFTARAHIETLKAYSVLEKAVEDAIEKQVSDMHHVSMPSMLPLLQVAVWLLCRYCHLLLYASCTRHQQSAQCACCMLAQHSL
jgi:hypothetical protein